jgi:hypothetical protein
MLSRNLSILHDYGRQLASAIRSVIRRFKINRYKSHRAFLRRWDFSIPFLTSLIRAYVADCVK